MRYTVLIFVAATLCIAGSANAQVFKCKGIGGKTIYSDAPCVDGAPGVVVDTRANVLESDSTRAAARGDFDEPRAAQPQRPSVAPSLNQSHQPIKPIDVIACKNAKRDLDLAKSKMSLEIARGKPPGPTSSAVRSAELGVDSACNTDLAATRARTEPKSMQYPSLENRSPQAPLPASPAQVVNCDPGGCWDTNGRRLNNAAGGNFHRSDGKFCTRAGPNLICN